MLRNVIDDYLTSSKEIQLYLPFIQLLEVDGYYDIHLIHGATEFGKDIIAKKEIDDNKIQFSFQLKAGDINSNRFRNDIRQQLIDAITNKLAHPNFDKHLPYRVIFVCSGTILPPTTLNFQEFNDYIEKILQAHRIDIWDKYWLLEKFLKIGIEPFFELCNSPEQVGRFFRFYSKITNDELFDVFEIEAYTHTWLNLQWDISINRLQIIFETYFFSRLLLDKARCYDASLVLSGLVRVLLKNHQYNNYDESILEYYQQIFSLSYQEAEKSYVEGKPFLMHLQGIFSIFYHPISCLKTMELLSLHILTSKASDPNVHNFFLKMLDEQKGCHRIISDNYAISVVLISLTLIKLNQLNRLRKYLNNVCVWLCDRYDGVGIASIGTNHQDELEQLLSEHLDGLTHHNQKSSFTACTLLDIAYLINDKILYEQIANDIRASEIVLEFYHILSDQVLYTHDDHTITTSMDHDFSLTFKDNYSVMIQHERESNMISSREMPLLFLIFLLRDRYFPSFMSEII